MQKHSPGRKTQNSPLLVVVYGLKTGDYAYFSEFYPARRLAQEAENRGIMLRFLFPEDVTSFLDSSLQHRTPQDTIFLFRGSVPLCKIEVVEKAGFTALNSSGSVGLANDKQETARFLKESGYPAPASFFPHEEPYPDLPWPVVCKPRFGSRGIGVSLASCFEDIPEGQYLLQEYVASSHGSDFRVFFAGGHILASTVRCSTRSDEGHTPLVSNTCTGGYLRPSPFTPAVPDSLATLTHEIAGKAGLWYGTIDYLFATPDPDPAHLLVCEMNAFPGFTALEQEGGTNIAGPLLDLIAGLFFPE